MENLQDKRVVITGGSSGLGKAMAEELVKRGAKVLITGRDASKIEKTASILGCKGLVSDVASDQDIQTLFQWIDANWDGLDILINNAGIAGWAEVDQLTRKDMQRVFEVNVFGAALMANEAAKRFKIQNSGDIVNIASTASQKGFSKGSIYAASKFALRAMNQCWQAELRPYNVRVIQVNPSEVPTAFGQEDRIEKEEVRGKLTAKEIAHVVCSALEMGRRGFIPEVSVFATNPF
jgi:3-oxoacyl-[acyl-carrier protein] reductase